MRRQNRLGRRQYSVCECQITRIAVNHDNGTSFDVALPSYRTKLYSLLMTTTTASRAGADLTEASAALESASRWIRRVTRPREVNAVNLATLDRLASGGPQRVSDLAASISVSQPGMTGVVTRLVEAGHVRRQSDPTDGRVALIEITPAGRSYLSDAQDRATAKLAEHITTLPVRQQRALAAAADALVALTYTTTGDRPA